MSKDLLKLQNANMFQFTKDGIVTSDWLIRETITGDTLHTLPKNIPDAHMFEIIDFARKYELLAWNEGIKFGKSQKNIYIID